ncbi:MAG: GNAT family N-acetyltransferase [Dehalococcoidia bacterium]|nr:GNAT family N-acetyltransferase [Dehalococcoidia bacterium]MCB9485191.1 GNAT family N-acetyltransferase [Thermoflexaceae bacterium]
MSRLIDAFRGRRGSLGDPFALEGHGLVLRLWDEELLAQMAAWSLHGFPYHAFDLEYLRDPARARPALDRMLQQKPHIHLVATEDGNAVGRVSVNLEDVAGLYLWSVHVPPEHEGKGVCRRMLATLIPWLELNHPGRQVVLTSNAFAERAHRAYLSLGFKQTDSRWQYDRELAAGLETCTPEQREIVAPYLRFSAGRWEVRSFVFARPSGLPIASDAIRRRADFEERPRSGAP